MYLATYFELIFYTFNLNRLLYAKCKRKIYINIHLSLDVAINA